MKVNIENLFNEIQKVFKERKLEDPIEKLKTWIGGEEILDYIINSNLNHPRKDFILEAMVLSPPLVYTFSVFANEKIYGTIPIQSISSITVSTSKEGLLNFQFIMDSGVAFRMHLLYDKWDEIISFKSEVQDLIKNIR